MGRHFVKVTRESYGDRPLEDLDPDPWLETTQVHNII